MGTERIAVIGADAAGMSAAHQALRTAKAAGRGIEVVALERTQDTSYSACGIPYWLAGDVDQAEDLVARSAERHREMGVDLRTGTVSGEFPPAALRRVMAWAMMPKHELLENWRCARIGEPLRRIAPLE